MYPGSPLLDINQLVFQHLLTIVLHPVTNIPNFASIQHEFLHHSGKTITKGLVKCIPEILIHYAYFLSLENISKVGTKVCLT